VNFIEFRHVFRRSNTETDEHIRALLPHYAFSIRTSCKECLTYAAHLIHTPMESQEAYVQGKGKVVPVLSTMPRRRMTE